MLTFFQRFVNKLCSECFSSSCKFEKKFQFIGAAVSKNSFINSYYRINKCLASYDVRIWQPSDCMDLFVIGYVFVCYSRKINVIKMMIVIV